MEENPTDILESFYSKNETLILLTLISTITLVILWILDRVFYCFRKAPPNATINIRRAIPTHNDDPMQEYFEQLENVPDDEKKRKEEEQKERLKQVRETQQQDLTQKAKLRSLDQRIAAIEQLEKKAKEYNLHVWPKSEQGHLLGEGPKASKEEEDPDIDDDQEVDEIVNLYEQLEQYDENSQNEEGKVQIMQRLAKMKERLNKKEQAQRASREEMLRIQRAKLEARRVAETAKLEQRLKAMKQSKKNIPASPIEVERQLKQEQDREFEESLKKDQEKEELVQNEVKIQNARKDRLAQRLAKSLTILFDPPESDSTCNILIRLPSGRRIPKRFYRSDDISSLLEFVDSTLIDTSDLELDEYNVVTHYPKRNISLEKGTIENVLGKENSHTIFVERP